MSDFYISASPGTDIWRKPPTTNIFNVPTKPHSSGPLSRFLSARVTFSAPWTEQYDQAGLVLSFLPSASSQPLDHQWIKTGVELYEGTPRLSTVACDRFADWSVSPVPGNPKSFTLSVVKETSSHGLSLWVYYHGRDGQKLALREICWVYADGPGDNVHLQIGAYAARPEAKATTESLEVSFSDLAVEWAPES